MEVDYLGSFEILCYRYDIRCIYIPSTDRSSWAELVQSLIPMLRQEQVSGGKERQVTLLGESFGGPLALRLARAAPDIISRLVLVCSSSTMFNVDRKNVKIDGVCTDDLGSVQMHLQNLQWMLFL